MSKLTLIGLYNYMEASEDDLFSNLSLPATIDRQTVIDNILLKGGEFECLYSNPYFVQNAIKVWSTKWSRTFSKWVEALSIEYSPLENYDRTETYTDTNTGTVKNDGNNFTNSNGTNKVSAYDSNDMVNSDANIAHADGENHQTQTNNLTVKHEARIRGNIGVTTSQQMLQAQLDVSYWNLYDHIADVFLQEFVIPIY